MLNREKELAIQRLVDFINKLPHDLYITISLEGNIGAGKSTLLKLIQKELGDVVEIIQEPVDIWTNCNGVDILGMFYSNMERYAYTFQTVTFTTRLAIFNQTPRLKRIRIIERSALTDKLFAENCHEGGAMSDNEMNIYNALWDFYVKNQNGTPDGIIYLSTEPKTCEHRMKIRDRKEEAGVPITYLEKLDYKHKLWVKEIQKTVPVCEVPSELNYFKDNAGQAKLVDKLHKLIRKISDKKIN